MNLDSASIRVERRAPPGWDDFVSGQDGADFSHLSRWSDVFDRTFGHEVLFAWIENAGVIRAALPVVRMPSLPWGSALVSMPYLNGGGPLGAPVPGRA